MKTENQNGYFPPLSQKVFFVVFLGLVIVLMIIFGITGAPLNTESAPYGVVSFELAGSVERTTVILSTWDPGARERAVFGLGLDFLFIPIYIIAIALGCTLASRAIRSRDWPLAEVGKVLVAGVCFAGFLDVIENISLLVIMFRHVSSPWPQIAFWCAVPKFSLIFLALVYALYGGVISLVIKKA
jgi:hypothetical protein